MISINQGIGTFVLEKVDKGGIMIFLIKRGLEIFKREVDTTLPCSSTNVNLPFHHLKLSTGNFYDIAHPYKLMTVFIVFVVGVWISMYVMTHSTCDLFLCH